MGADWRSSLVVEGAQPSARIRVLSVDGERVAAAAGRLVQRLDRGMYTVQVYGRSGQEERLVWLDGRTNVTVSFKQRPKPPLAELEDVDAVPDALRREVGESAGDGARVIVAAASGVANARVTFGGDAEPLVLQGRSNVVAVARDATAGRAILEHEVPGLGWRAQPVLLVSGWETQIYLAGPRESGQRVKLYLRPRGDGYQPERLREYEAVDAALEGLAHGEVVLDEVARHGLEQGTVDDPLLALIVAYAALAEGAEALAQTCCRLAATVFDDSPDVLVLRAILGGSGSPVGEPPLLAVATDRLLELAQSRPDLVPPSSSLAAVVYRLRAGGSWTRWEVGDGQSDRELRIIEREVALLRAERGVGVRDVARLLGVPESLLPAIRRRTALWARWQTVRIGARRLVAYLPVWMRLLPRRIWHRFLAYERGPGVLDRAAWPEADQLVRHGDQRPGEVSSRVRAADAGWEPGTEPPPRPTVQRDLAGPAPGEPWAGRNRRRPVSEFVSDLFGRLIDKARVERERERWVEDQRAAGAFARFPGLIVPRTDASRCIILGATGAADPSAEAATVAQRTEVSDFTILLGDVIHPAHGSARDSEASSEQGHGCAKPVYAIPAIRDWYDGLQAFMLRYCGARPSAAPSSRSIDSVLGRIARWFADAAGPGPRIVSCDHRESQEPTWTAGQPGPYWAIDIAGGVRLVAIDTGISGTVDRRQGEWLLEVSRAPGPKILLTTRAIWSNGDYHPCPISWHGNPPPGESLDTADDIVRDPRFTYLAAIGVDARNYQRQSVTVVDDGLSDSGPIIRTIEYVVAGGTGAHTRPTHRIGRVDQTGDRSQSPPPSGVRPPQEEDFRCYPTRGDSLAYCARWYRGFLPTALRAAALTLLLAIVAVFAWESFGHAPEPGLVRVMLLALVGVAGIPLAVALLVWLTRRLFPPGSRTAAFVILLGWGLLLASIGVSAATPDHAWIWQAPLIGLTVTLALLGLTAGWQRLANRHRLIRDALLCILLVFATRWYFGDLLVTAVALSAVAVFLWISTGAFAGPSGASARLVRRWSRYVPAIVGLAIIVALVTRFWDAWAVRVGVAAWLAGCLVVSSAALLLFATGGRRALIDLHSESLDPDQALGYLYDRGVAETLPDATDRRRLCRIRDFDLRTVRICQFLLPGTRGPRRWLAGIAANLVGTDGAPEFKSYVTLSVEDGELILSCMAVTGRDHHERQPPREDCVRIGLPSKDRVDTTESAAGADLQREQLTTDSELGLSPQPEGIGLDTLETAQWGLYELVRILANLFPSVESVRNLCRSAGVDLLDDPILGPPLSAWAAAVGSAVGMSRLDTLMRIAQDAQPEQQAGFAATLDRIGRVEAGGPAELVLAVVSRLESARVRLTPPTAVNDLAIEEYVHGGTLERFATPSVEAWAAGRLMAMDPRRASLFLRATAEGSDGTVGGIMRHLVERLARHQRTEISS